VDVIDAPYRCLGLHRRPKSKELTEEAAVLKHLTSSFYSIYLSAIIYLTDGWPASFDN
jgi:hypothetical protein